MSKIRRRVAALLSAEDAGYDSEDDLGRSAWETRRQVGSTALVGLIIVVLIGLVITGGGTPTAAPPADKEPAARPRVLAPVPEVTGLSQADAVRKLRAAGFEGTISVSRADERVAKGLVANQVPAPGIRAPKGSTIELALSLGPADRTVPNLVGYPASGALTLLQRTGLRHTVSPEVSDLPFGTVLRTSPPAGSQVAKGTEVDLVLSSGSWLDGLPPGGGDGLLVLDASVDQPASGGNRGNAAPAPSASPQPPSSTASGVRPTPAPVRPPTTSPPPTSPPPTSPPPTSPPPTSPPPTSPPPTSPPTCVWLLGPSGPFQYCS